ncbi:MAG: hypothetical protein WKF58_10860 [Ilumatobacteraceae bacterium]
MHVGDETADLGRRRPCAGAIRNPTWHRQHRRRPAHLRVASTPAFSITDLYEHPVR